MFAGHEFSFQASQPPPTDTRLLPGHGEVATTFGSTSFSDEDRGLKVEDGKADPCHLRFSFSLGKQIALGGGMAGGRL
jgi:hypothetical protein